MEKNGNKNSTNGTKMRSDELSHFVISYDKDRDAVDLIVFKNKEAYHMLCSFNAETVRKLSQNELDSILTDRLKIGSTIRTIVPDVAKTKTNS